MSILSAQSVAVIEESRRTAPSAQSVLLTALRLTQKERRRIGVEEVEYLASLLGVSNAVVEGVARFYDELTKEATGRHIVSVCRGIACHLRGGAAAIEDLRQGLGVGPGEITADGRLTFRLVECIGDCDHAPAMMFDKRFLGAASVADVRAELDRG